MPNFPPQNYTFLWNDDAEGGDSLCLVLMEREAAAAYSHDLAGEGETIPATKNVSHIWSILFLISPVIILLNLNI